MNANLPANLGPTEFLQLVGHPVRWRLLGELARSDRLVHELTGLIGEPQNLVSYHLAKLRDARLVSAQRSSADRRDAYYTLDLTRIGSLMGATSGTIHPGLHPAISARVAPKLTAARVLFLCTGNSARSQMAEALVKVRSSGVIQTCSAGSHPKPIHPNALRVMRDEHGIDISNQTSKHLDAFVGQRFDWVISLCDRVREVCPEFPGNPATIHWSTPNPADAGTDDESSYPLFRQVASGLDTRIGFLLALFTDQSNPP